MKRKSVKCPKELQARMDQLNLIPPLASPVEWLEFEETIRAIEEAASAAFLTGTKDLVAFRKEWKEHDQYVVREISKRIARKFQPLAYHAAKYAALGMERTINELRTEYGDFIALVNYVAKKREGGREVFFTQITQSVIVLDDWTLEPFTDSALSMVKDHKLPTNRLRICPVEDCQRVFWQANAGAKRQSQTCGRKKCAVKWGNWKRSKQYLETKK